MSVSGSIIKSPVTISDIKNTLGVNSAKLSYLCRNEHGKINKWSKIKPVIVDSVTVQIAKDNITIKNPFTGSSLQVPGYYGNGNATMDTITIGTSTKLTLNYYEICGLKIPTYTSTRFLVTSSTGAIIYAQVMDYLAESGDGWAYGGPTDSYCRLLDFDGYDHSVTQPIYYWVKQTVYAACHAQVACYREVSDTAVDITSFINEYFPGCNCYAFIMRNGSYVETIEIGSFENNIDSFAIGDTLYRSEAEYKVYFVAQNPTTGLTVFLPNTTEYANPLTFQTSLQADPNDYNANPFAALYWLLYDDDSASFAYSMSSSYWEVFRNVGENENTFLATDAQYTLKMTFRNTTSNSVTIDLTKLLFKWYAWNAGSKQYALLNYSAYDSDKNRITGSVAVEGDATYTFYFVFSNVFYDGADNVSYTPTEYENYGEMDIAEMLYNDVRVQDFNILVQYVKNSSTYRGKFWNESRGYFSTK